MIKTNLNNLLGKSGIIVSYSALFFLATHFGKSTDYFDVFIFVLGLSMGMGLLELDELFLYKYYDPKNKQLATRSLLFLISLFPLGLFLMTSTGSIIGVGMFLSIISGLSLDLFSYKNNLPSFQKRFLFQLKRNISKDEQTVLITVFISLSVLYAFMVIF